MRNEKGHKVFPIFYHVDPSDLRKQRGKVDEAFAKHEEIFKDNKEKTQRWRFALTEVANIKGWHLSSRHDEAEFIKEIIKRVSTKLCQTFASPPNDIIGIQSRLEELRCKIDAGHVYDQVRVIGICGMGGLDNIQHLLCLIGKRGWLGLGSRVIITTRDEHLLQMYGVDVVYKPMKLNATEALRLFSLKAFRSDTPAKDFVKLSENVVEYADGIPLALEVLGSFLSGISNAAQWRSAVERLKKESKKEIIDKLGISFDGLEETEKDIFLDIACFFKGDDKDMVTKILDGCDSFPDIGIDVLIKKSLITIDEDNKLSMHYLLQEMGKKIVRQESPNRPGKRSRLWEDKDIHYVLAENTATEAVQGITSGRTGVQNKTLALSADAFLKMKRLWLLRPLPKLKSVDLKGCENLAKTPDFSMVPNLESLILEGTRISDFYPTMKSLRRLKILSLKDCKSLRSFPSEIGKKSLETLILSGCLKIKTIQEIVGEIECLRQLCLDGTGIKELPSSIGHLRSLELLTLKDCSKLECLPNSIGRCESLENLNLCACSKLEDLPENLQQIKSLRELDLSETSIAALPPFIFHMESLKFLYFHGCKRPPSRGRSLWPFISRTTERQGLNSMTQRLPVILSGLSTMKDLDLNHCNIRDGAIPNDICNLSNLEILSLSDNDFTTLPTTIGRLSKITFLTLTDCQRLKSLPELPANTRLSVEGCTSLEELAIPATACNYPRSYGYINALNCFKMAETNNVITVLNRSLKVVAKERTGHFSIFIPGSEVPRWFRNEMAVSSNSVTKMPLPPNFLNDGQIVGFVFCFVFSSNFDYSPGRLEFVSLECTIHGRNFSCKVGGNKFHLEAGSKRVTEDHLWLYFMPFDDLDFSSLEELICDETEISGSNIDMAKERFEMEVVFKVENIGSKEKKCGARIVYEKDLEEMDETIDEHGRSTSSNFDDSHSNDGSTGNNIGSPHEERMANCQFIGHFIRKIIEICFPCALTPG
ncbi:hypothetical protein F3Y22_tig00110472pilonHSYRG00147 [Hibiscus syriacus]|uniref:TIR domain-containing protein n=1 Tax=Hibiscus syriacus TaxID=106335 RepID=A0A6A3AHJ8_HIBSY|nr:hypothetical protein F3Y22_tig00110472pilonHSYRG00147 [Hibiscus syriacus]